MRIKASRTEIARSLQGNWRPELLFVLQQEVEMYDTYQRRIAECDQSFFSTKVVSNIPM